MSTVGGDIAAARTRSPAPPSSAPSAPPASPTTGQTEVLVAGKHWGPDAARQAQVALPPSFRDRLATWFPGVLAKASDNTAYTVQRAGPDNPWAGSLVLLAASASLLVLRHRLAVHKVPFGAMLVHPRTNQPLVTLQAKAAGTSATRLAKVSLGTPMTLVRDPTFAQASESINSVTLDEAMAHWHTVHKGMALGSVVLAGMALWNVAMSPVSGQEQQSTTTVAVGQMGERR